MRCGGASWRKRGQTPRLGPCEPRRGLCEGSDPVADPLPWIPDDEAFSAPGHGGRCGGDYRDLPAGRASRHRQLRAGAAGRGRDAAPLRRHHRCRLSLFRRHPGRQRGGLRLRQRLPHPAGLPLHGGEFGLHRARGPGQRRGHPAAAGAGRGRNRQRLPSDGGGDRRLPATTARSRSTATPASRSAAPSTRSATSSAAGSTA